MVSNLFNYRNFFEASVRSETNMGDVLEPLFAICVFLYLTYGTIEFDKVNYIRKDVVPESKKRELETYSVTIKKNNETVSIPGTLSLVFKGSTTKGYFGPQAKNDDTVSSLVSVINTTIGNIESISKIKLFLDGLQKDYGVSYSVQSVGASNTQEKGSKADISVEVHKGPETVIDVDIPLPSKLSLKYGNNTSKMAVANLGFLKAIHSIAREMQLPLGQSLSNIEKLPSNVHYWALSDLIRDPGTYNTKAEFKSAIEDPDNLAFYINRMLPAFNAVAPLSNKAPPADDGSQASADAIYKHEDDKQKIATANASVNADADILINKLYTQLKASSNLNDTLPRFIIDQVYGNDANDLVTIGNNLHSIKKDDLVEILKKYNFSVGGMKNTVIPIMGTSKNTENSNNESNNIFNISFTANPSNEKIKLPYVRLELGDRTQYN